MKLDKEEHREFLLAVVAAVPISGPIGAPELVAKVALAQDLLRAIESAEVEPSAADKD